MLLIQVDKGVLLRLMGTFLCASITDYYLFLSRWSNDIVNSSNQPTCHGGGDLRLTVLDLMRKHRLLLFAYERYDVLIDFFTMLKERTGLFKITFVSTCIK
jgi:hypothetical protein